MARDRRIAASTVSRAYRELARRGLVVGETGRRDIRAGGGGRHACGPWSC